ncbi:MULTISPECIES: ferredoxin [Streptomyces]|uniref:Ferredoxin n=1 Tax=Streptomyces pseudovenezuelae TaxID=67350 RepID=A0A101ND33_9ACTN|nr:MULTISPECIES: ferredoxin [Streptomyces]KUM91001.1 ferredoxin [Streptomyces pseudovenezuelae]WUA91345.1 ferredoxin [Streptomyces pseudovenezuelae]
MEVHPVRAESGVGAGDRWHVEVDRSLCIGSAQCVHTAPDGFRLDAARQSHPADPETDASEKVLAAAENCPVEAIMITLLGSEEPVFPPEE